jgi:hypothetical protein
MRTDWQKLVKKFADGREVCNCGDAYYTNCGRGSVLKDGVWESRNDLPVCRYGCSVNQLNARDEIAGRLVELIDADKSIVR